MTDRATKQFLRWRDRGDARALADLFDRTAPELLRVGLHLCGNVADAEDLLQATFVAAIESAERFDASRRVVPWLVAILTHRAHAERRRQRRAPVNGVDGDAVAGNGAGPVAAAAASELAGISLRALDGLPEPYRQPTMLRVAQGMDPAAIALLLGRSPATVRSQIHRGLEQVRRRLPAGAGAVAACGGERGLAAVKGAVLKHAGATFARGVGAGAVVAGGVLMTAKTLTILVLLGGIAVAIGIAASPGSAQPGQPAPESPIQVTTAAPPTPSAVADRIAMPTQEASTAPAPAPPDDLFTGLRKARPEEVTWLLRQLDFSYPKSIERYSGTDSIDDRYQLAYARYHAAEDPMLAAIVRQGEAYVSIDGKEPCASGAEGFQRGDIFFVRRSQSTGPLTQVQVYIPVRWSEHPDILALKQEAENTRVLEQELSAINWNKLPYEERRRIVEAGRAAHEQMQALSQEMETLRQQGKPEDGPELAVPKRHYAALGQLWRAMPQSVDANYLAVPGRTSFNKTY